MTDSTESKSLSLSLPLQSFHLNGTFLAPEDKTFMTGGQESVCVKDIVLDILSLLFSLRLFSVSLFLLFDDSFGAFSSVAVFV